VKPRRSEPPWILPLILLSSAAGVAGCRPEGRQAAHEPAAAAERAPAATTPALLAPTPPVASAVPPPAPPAARGPASVDRLPIPGDLIASVVRAADGSPPRTVFLPGMCSNANAYLQTFPEAARRHGGVIAVEGDQPCGTGGFRSFSWDAARLHGRVSAALAAAGLSEIPAEGITLVGYSQGASLAEQMVQRWPHRYARVVLIGAPTDPSPKNLARSRALVTMSCDRDVPARMKQAAKSASRAGVPATYFEMPGCTHGNVTEGERIFDETFEWLRTNERVISLGSPPT
jgi:predicted esterase